MIRTRDKTSTKSLKGVANQTPKSSSDDYEEKMLEYMRIYCKNADEAFQQGLNEKRELVAPEIRKETAKEILQPLYEKADIGTHDENNDFAYACLQFRSRILAIAKRYGVEVKE